MSEYIPSIYLRPRTPPQTPGAAVNLGANGALFTKAVLPTPDQSPINQTG